MKFRKVGADTSEIDIVQYTKGILEEYPQLEVFVGTDSQNHRRKTQYAVAVSYRVNLGDKEDPIYRGVHYVIAKDSVKPKLKDIKERLRRETLLTMDISLLLRDNLPKADITVELDYSPEKTKDVNLSAEVVVQMSGWAKGAGFKVNIKPEAHMATKPADRHCRH